MSTSTASLDLDRRLLLARFDRVRRRSRELFALIADDAYYSRPITLRNPIVFYEGHLAAFSINTLIKKALHQPGIDDELEVLFARGIDPELSPSDDNLRALWPSRDRVAAYVRESDARLREEIRTDLPLERRREYLEQLPLKSPLALVERLDAARPWEQACAEGWEGVIAKRLGSVYESRRSPAWLKMKCEVTQTFVVGGFTDPQGARVGLGALLVGHFQDNELLFAGKVGTGFDSKLLRDLRQRLDQLEIAASPFTSGKGLPRIRAHWVRPEIVVEVGFIEWTVHKKLRHPRLLRVVS